MSQSTMTPPKPAVEKTGWRTRVLLGLTLVGAAIFLAGFAFPYFTLNPQRFGFYWPKRGWLLLHIGGGMVGILAGPFAIWLGLSRQRMRLHRSLGIAYISSMSLSSIAALYLAFHTDVNWVFGMGLSGLAVAWIVTTALALVSIRRRLITQHKEWMIRSYVLTFAFVNFRVLVGVLQVAGVGAYPDQLVAASWFCWAVPLLITEAFLQGRKIFRSKIYQGAESLS